MNAAVPLTVGIPVQERQTLSAFEQSDGTGVSFETLQPSVLVDLSELWLCTMRGLL